MPGTSARKSKTKYQNSSKKRGKHESKKAKPNASKVTPPQLHDASTPQTDPNDQPRQDEATNTPNVVYFIPAQTNVAPIPPPPFITNPGNGPRVLDVVQFLASPFADQPSTTDPRCLDLGSPEVLPILAELLPPEVALILHYNVTRKFGRVCPACRRIYRLGDTLPPHLPDGQDRLQEGPRTLLEQSISGLCSWMCFALATYQRPPFGDLGYPGSIGAWGLMGDSMDEAMIEYLNGPGDQRIPDEEGLGQLLRMTRNYDLGISEFRPRGTSVGCEDPPEPLSSSADNAAATVADA
ncbi:hypothetical protein FRB99_000018 [Tulasnella sp. 403]|nr:hypothetical protein FRB99_000018 [Tulasnella sp. 403]